MATDLEQLAKEITTVGETISTLKSAGGDNKDAIGSAVANLLALKKQYAEANNGIGVDGKPYEEPLTKAQKKAKAKAEKNKAKGDAAAAAPAAGSSEVSRETFVCCMFACYHNIIISF